MNHPIKSSLVTALVAAISHFGTHSVSAVAVSFDNGGGDYSWFTGTNWSNNLLPTSSDDVSINANSSALNPVFVNGATATPRSFTLGTANGNSGYLSIGSTGTINITSVATQFIGNAGTGSVTQVAGSSVSMQRGFDLGSSVGGIGTWDMSGGTLTSGAFATNIGNAGTGTFTQSGGTANIGGGITLGSALTGIGTYNLSGSAILNAGTNRVSTIGGSGTGTLNLAGGTVNGGGTAAAIIVRANASGVGIIQGTGTFTYGTTTGTVLLTNNGKVIADGNGTNATLSFVGGGFTNSTQGVTGNTIENTTDNGYYAQEKGQLTIARISAGLNGAGTKSVTFGEAVGDTTLDLVNSARFGFSANSTNLAVSVSLLANDRTGLVAEPTNVNFIGLWNLTISDGGETGFSAANYQFRYDNIAAGGDVVSLYRLNGAVWDLQSFSIDATNHILTTTDASITQINNTFAIGYAVPEPSTVALLAGACLTIVFLSVRRRQLR